MNLSRQLSLIHFTHLSHYCRRKTAKATQREREKRKNKAVAPKSRHGMQDAGDISMFCLPFLSLPLSPSQCVRDVVCCNWRLRPHQVIADLARTKEASNMHTHTHSSTTYMHLCVQLHMNIQTYSASTSTWTSTSDIQTSRPVISHSLNSPSNQLGQVDFLSLLLSPLSFSFSCVP